MADSPYYEVEKILGRRYNRQNEMEYYVRWKNFSKEWDTWEPEKTLGNCKAAIKAFNEKIYREAEEERARIDKQMAAKTKKAAAAGNQKITKKAESEKAGTDKPKAAKMKKVVSKVVKKNIDKDLNGKLTKKKAAKDSNTKIVKSKNVNKNFLKVKLFTNSAKKELKLNKGRNTKFRVKPYLSKKSTSEVSKTETGDSKKTVGTVKKNEKKVGKLGRPKAARKYASNQSSSPCDSSDEDVRYSLASPVVNSNTAAAAGGHSVHSNEHGESSSSKAGSSSVSKNKNTSSPSKGSARKKLKLDIGVRASNVQETTGGAFTSVAPTSPRKLLLKDSIPPRTKVVKPVPRSPAAMKQTINLTKSPSERSPTPKSPTQAKSLLIRGMNGPTVFKTPPSSPRSTRSRSITPITAPCTPSPSKSDYFNDLPTIPVIPIIPNSPSAASYKQLIANLPQKLQANKHLKRKHGGGGSEESDGDEEVIERRLSVRQSESAYKYKEIVVKKYQGYTQVWLFTTSRSKNVLNPKVFEELIAAFTNAKYDDSRVLMLSGTGSVFCSGIDLEYLRTGDRKASAKKMADSLREFLSVLISFPKPVVVAVNGPAVGLGVAILPLCDIVYASDKASFYLPYARLHQTPEGCSSFTFPQVLSMPMANEMLLAGRKLTAIEAHQAGIVSQVFWPTSMMQEVIPRVQNMAEFSAMGLEASKLLIRSHQRAKLEFTNESECNMLQERWASIDCHRAIKAYMEDEQDLLC